MAGEDHYNVTMNLCSVIYVIIASTIITACMLTVIARRWFRNLIKIQKGTFIFNYACLHLSKFGILPHHVGIDCISNHLARGT